MATSPSAREMPLALPNVYSTNPRRTSSRLASSTSSLKRSSIAPRSLRAAATRRSAGKTSPHATASDLRLPNAKYSFRYNPYNSSIGPRPKALGSTTSIFGTQRVLRFFHGFESAGGQEGEDRRAQAGDFGLGTSTGLFSTLRVDAIQRLVLLRDAAAVDDAVYGHAVLLHALQNDAGMEGRALDGCEEFVLRGVREVPAERDAAQFRIHQYRTVAVIPGQAQQAGLAGGQCLEPRETRPRWCPPARRSRRRYRRWPTVPLRRP